MANGYQPDPVLVKTGKKNENAPFNGTIMDRLLGHETVVLPAACNCLHVLRMYNPTRRFYIQIST